MVIYVDGQKYNVRPWSYIYAMNQWSCNYSHNTNNIHDHSVPLAHEDNTRIYNC